MTEIIKKYSLLKIPWILAKGENGRTQSYSLIDLFDNIDDIVALDNDTMGQNIAIIRFLAAIAYRANDPVLTDDWDIWYKNGFPKDRVIRYLQEHEDDFWLQHPTRPFLQTNIEPVKDRNGNIPSGVSHVEKIAVDDAIGDSVLFARKNGIRTFTPEESARWLLAEMLYDPLGVHPSYTDCKYGTALHPKASTLMRSSVIYPDMGNLGKTVLTITIPLDSGLISIDARNENLSAGIPSWEQEPLNPVDCDPKIDGGRGQAPKPTSVLDCLTWRSRLARLFFDDDNNVNMTIITTGIPLDITDGQDHEPMSLWRVDKKTGSIFPKSIFDASDKETWRGLSSLFQYDEALRGSSVAPHILRWLHELMENDIIDKSAIIRIHMYTVFYGSMSSSVTDAVDDSIDIPIDTINTDRSTIIMTAMGFADKAAWVYGVALGKCAKAQGQSFKDANAQSAYVSSMLSPLYASLENAFRQWLIRFSQDGSDLSTWMEIVGNICMQDLQNYAKLLPSSAYYGIVKKSDDGKISRESVPDALSYLHNTLQKMKGVRV